jgi:DNA polymerase
MGLIEEYKALSDQIRACTKCPLCASRYQVVVDRGNPEARLMLIGEAPGANEDAQGEAFVGRAGQLLDELLQEAGITEFIIINVIKCRPPENKFPGDAGSQHPEEIVNECLPWLDAQIEMIRPKAIILVGHKAASWTLYRGKTSTPLMKDLLGKRFRCSDYRNIEFFTMYHTSYLLRTQNMDKERSDQIRASTIEMMKVAKTVVDGDLPDDEPVQIPSRRPQTDQMKFF